ncbi:MAG: porin, partial [Tidjanibacter sp.]|nr:porin [Tidjanibacter sp.]
SWNTIYSLNFMQSTPDRMVNYIALGNRFGLGDVAVELDFMNRASMDEFSLLENFSIMADVTWGVNEKLNLFGKVTYDQNTTNDIADGCVLPGSKLTRVGGGVEYFPFGGRDVRLHASASYVMGESVVSVITPKSLMFNVGLTWRLNLLARN